MLLDLQVRLDYAIASPTDLIVQVRAPDFPDQRVRRENIDMSPADHVATVAGEAGVGARLLLRSPGDFTYDYSARIAVDRPALDLAPLNAVPPNLLPGDVVRYLMPSRYCPSDEMQSYVSQEFADVTGGARVAAIRDWIFGHFRYVPGSSNGQTTAIDTFVQRQGVCRDYAHVLITMARASAIPARFASVYAPHVTPQDFHAVAEVYLDGTWHLVDATGMATADQIVRIGVGMDAAEVPFLSSFGPMDMRHQSVAITVLD